MEIEIGPNLAELFKIIAIGILLIIVFIGIWIRL